MLPSLLAVLILTAVWLAVIRYGADSRDGQDWQSGPAGQFPPDRAARPRAHSPARDLALLYRLLRRAGSRLVEFNRAQVDLWERYLLAQRPVAENRLHWVRTREGWRLVGRVAPPAPTQRRLSLGGRTRPRTHRGSPC